MSQAHNCISFELVFLVNRSIKILLYEKAELLSVTREKMFLAWKTIFYPFHVVTTFLFLE